VTTAVAGSDETRLARWEQQTRWVIVLAALIPLFGALGDDSDIHSGQLGIDVLAWLVFAVDLAVHLRLRRRYLRTWRGVLDVAIVIVTFPWYVLPGLSGSQLLVTARLARLARIVVVVVKGGIARVVVRLGKTAVFAVSLAVAAAIIVKQVEPPSSGFDSFGDSLWWAVVTITTVGYGDLVPVTVQGRIAAGVLMVGGLAVLGSIAATLGAYLYVEEGSGGFDPDELTLASLLGEIRALHHKVDSLTDEPPSSPREEPPA